MLGLYTTPHRSLVNWEKSYKKTARSNWNTSYCCIKHPKSFRNYFFSKVIPNNKLLWTSLNVCRIYCCLFYYNGGQSGMPRERAGVGFVYCLILCISGCMKKNMFKINCIIVSNTRLITLILSIQRWWWSWSYGSWIYNYLCNQCLSPLTLWIPFRWGVLDTTLCDKVCQWLVAGRWFSQCPPVSLHQ